MTHTPAVDSLPPLPQKVVFPFTWDERPRMGFSAAQMRQYALVAIALTRPPGGSERLRELVAKWRALASVLRESKGGRNYRVRGAGIVAASHVDDCADELERLVAGPETGTWFGPDVTGGWHVKHGDLFFYARPQEMKSPDEFVAAASQGEDVSCGLSVSAGLSVYGSHEAIRKLREVLASPQGAEQRQEGESVRQAAFGLREAQRAYMADRGNEAKGKAVAAAAERLDAALGEPTKSDRFALMHNALDRAAVAVSAHPAQAASQGDAVAHETYDLRFWQAGVCGNANVVTFDGEDVRAVCRIEDATLRATVIEAHNKVIRALSSPPGMRVELPAHVRASAEFLAKRLNHAPCDSDGVSGCVRCNAIVLARHVLGIRPPSLRYNTAAIAQPSSAAHGGEVSNA